MSNRKSLSHRKKSSLWLTRIKRVATWIVGIWIVSVLLLRVIDPPTTPLIVLRAVEYWIKGQEVVQEQRWIDISEVPRRVQQAVVAAEDARFMQHWGIDFGALDDVLDDAAVKKRVRGASTITMQTVKNIFLWPGRSYVRKVLEGVMTPIAGCIWGKRRTLELYLNVVEWGQGIYGIEAASRRYFHKSARDLSVEEAGALAAILPSPRRLSPHSLSKVARRRFLRIRAEAHGTLIPE